MIPSIIRRAAQQAVRQTGEKVPYIYTNPYKALRQWPPDFSKLSQKHQFRFERKFKRRMKLKWLREKWVKAITIIQMSSILALGIYAVLFMDWNDQGNPDHPPFHTFRTWFFGLSDSMWTKPARGKRTDLERLPTKDSPT